MGLRAPLKAAERPHDIWGLDFGSDVPESGRRFRVLEVEDQMTCTGLAAEVDTSLLGGRVVRVLDSLVAEHGKPMMAILVPFYAWSSALWRVDYNAERPLSSLSYLTPNEFATNWHAAHSIHQEPDASPRPATGRTAAVYMGPPRPAPLPERPPKGKLR
jgi:transposase InsO family protein